jgi:XRE family transcriptional regulator, aerobic/anaerobic benzoate catabolism transcriptional regulator
VRARRTALGLTLRELGERAHVSERFLVQLEGGSGNISVARLLDVAEALGTSPAALLTDVSISKAPIHRTVALVGLRGAGKSEVGSRVAAELAVPFVELDVLVAREAGMSLATMFEMHGEAYFRRAEEAALVRLLDQDPCVVATSGSIVTNTSTWATLRERSTTVWLRANAEDHWSRVVAQGDGRPMKGRPEAMSELRALLKVRRPLYAQAEHTIDTSSITLLEAVREVARIARDDRAREGSKR